MAAAMAGAGGGQGVLELPGPFCPGDVVRGRFLDDEWYAAMVQKAVGDGLYEIAWLDGDTADCLKRAHELRPMRYHAELKCYLEVPCSVADAQATSQSTASDQPADAGSDSKSDTDDNRGEAEEETSSCSRAPKSPSARSSEAHVEGGEEEEEEEEDWMEQMVSALDGEAAEDPAVGGQLQRPGRKPEVRPKEPLPQQRREVRPREARAERPNFESARGQQPLHSKQAQEPSAAGPGARQPSRGVAWQEPQEIADLRTRVSRQALQIAKPPPAVSFTEMWCYQYFLHNAAPKERRRSGPLIAEVGDLWFVVGGPEGGLSVSAERVLSSKRAPCPLAAGSLVRALEREDGRLRYALLTGSGPASGWVTIGSQVRPWVVRVVADAGVEIDESSGQNVRSWGALPVKTCRIAESTDCLHCRCRIPAGGCVGTGLEGEVLHLHAECMTRLLYQAQGAFCARLEEERDEAESRADEEMAWKRLFHMERSMQECLRAKYDIGWREDLVPCNVGPAGRLGLQLAQQGMCCLIVDEDQLSMRLARTNHPGVSLNLEYLSIALQVGLMEGAQPWFSLDPVDPKCPTTMLTKNFGPEWLAGTSVGDVLFQADYYLKELSMGQYKQPMPGMTSCWDFANGDITGPEWDARIWFVVLEAEVNISEDDVLIPCVKMGVEARELVSGSYEDAPVTRPDHPLVKYAEMFTRNFDAIAERVSVVYYLRELAKASALAKFLADNGYDARSGEWLSVAGAARECQAEAPRLWSRRLASDAEAVAAVALAAQEGGTNMLYGGVDLSLARFVLRKPKRVSARLSAEVEDCAPPEAAGCAPPPAAAAAAAPRARGAAGAPRPAAGGAAAQGLFVY